MEIAATPASNFRIQFYRGREGDRPPLLLTTTGPRLGLMHREPTPLTASHHAAVILLMALVVMPATAVIAEIKTTMTTARRVAITKNPGVDMHAMVPASR